MGLPETRSSGPQLIPIPLAERRRSPFRPVRGGSRVRLLGADIDDVTMREAVERIGALVRSGVPSLVVTPNVDHLIRLRRDEEFRAIYREASLVLADGMPLLWAARFLGTPLREKVSGSDLFPNVCAMAARRGLRIFLLGGRPGAAERAAEAMKRRYPELAVAGTHCPPLGFETDRRQNAAAFKAVRDASPDILFVGLGSPKQEKWAYRYRDITRVPVTIGVGVTFEFATGMVRRAPVPMQRAGLEWLWRLAMEPGRLWRRYLVDDMRFFWYLALERASARRPEEDSRVS